MRNFLAFSDEGKLIITYQGVKIIRYLRGKSNKKQIINLDDISNKNLKKFGLTKKLLQKFVNLCLLHRKDIFKLEKEMPFVYVYRKKESIE